MSQIARLSVFLLASAAALLAQQRLPHYGDNATAYETVKVAEGIYTFVAPDSKTPLVSGNSTVIIGDEGALVVDSTHFPSLAKKMISEIRSMTGQPVRYLVNSHWHPDHFTGNAAYREAFPGIAIVSTAPTRDQYEKGWTYNDVDRLGKAVPRLREIVDTGIGKDGKSLSAEDRDFYREELAGVNVAIREWSGVKHIAPDTIFDRQLTVFLGKREVDVMFLGRGNTMGDAVIYVPDTKTLITGDLLVNPVPYCYGSFFTEWIDTLQKLNAMDATAIVPGHGPVEHDKQHLQQVIRMFQSMVRQAKEAVQKGQSLDEFRKSIDLAEFRRQMAGADYFQNRDFDDSVIRAGLERTYREAKEGPLKDED